MNIAVRPVVKAGVDRGGENLFLEFLCFKFDREPIEFELLEDEGCCYYDNSLDLDESHYDEDGEPDPEKITHQYTTDHYEIEWSGSLEDLRKLVTDLGVHDETKWVWHGTCDKAPKKMFKKQHYVGGNAE